MPEELAFARKASGLVRGLSFWDVFGMGLAFITPIYGIWYIIEVGLTLYPPANLLIAILISLVTIGWASPIVWGVLGGTMPRSGGEYIYNSRIINPAIAMGASFTAVSRGLYWNLFNASMFAVPSLAILGQYMGWTGLANFATSKGGGGILSVVCIAIAFGIIVFGMRSFTSCPCGRRQSCVGVWRSLTLRSPSPLSRVSSQLGRPGRQVPLAPYHQPSSRLPGTLPEPLCPPRGTGATPSVLPQASSCYSSGPSASPTSVARSSAPTRPSSEHSSWQWECRFCSPSGRCLLSATSCDFNFLRAAAFQDYSAATKGYALPYSTSYMSTRLHRLRRELVHRLVASFTFLVTMLWLIVGLADRGTARHVRLGYGPHGPRWFTTINTRTARRSSCTASGGHLGFSLLAYWYLFPSVLTGLVARACSWSRFSA